MLAEKPTSPQKTILWIKTGVEGITQSMNEPDQVEMAELVPAPDE